MDIATLLRRTAGQSLADTAVSLASAGVPVFPCRPGRKVPRTRHGFHDASAIPDRVASWWRAWPTANIGVPTGSISGLDVLDVDEHPGASGRPALDRASREGFTRGWTALIRTPSGGTHLYYPARTERAQRSWQLSEAHVDFRGDGGYVLVPPSVVSTRTAPGQYSLVAFTHRDTAPIDALALRAFLDPQPIDFPRRYAAGGFDGTDAERLARWVAARQEGGRNSALFWAACRLAEANLPRAEAHAVLGAAARVAGLPDAEIAATIRSAYRTAHPAAERGLAPSTPRRVPTLAIRDGGRTGI